MFSSMETVQVTSVTLASPMGECQLDPYQLPVYVIVPTCVDLELVEPTELL